MSAPKYDIQLAQGETFYTALTLDEGGAVMDLTGYAFEGQIRATPEDPILCHRRIRQAEFQPVPDVQFAGIRSQPIHWLTKLHDLGELFQHAVVSGYLLHEHVLHGCAGQKFCAGQRGQLSAHDLELQQHQVDADQFDGSDQLCG